MINNTSATFFNLIKLNATSKKLFFFNKLTKKVFQLIKILTHIGFVRKYFLIKKNNSIFIKIYFFYYKNLPLFSSFKLISTISKYFFISYKALNILTQKTGGSVFLLHTTKGLITHHDALKYKVGGKIFAQISL